MFVRRVSPLNLVAYVKTEAKATKNLLVCVCFPGYVEASSLDRVQIPVAIFSKSATVSKRYLVEKQRQPGFHGALRELILTESVLVGRDVGLCEDGRNL